MLPTNLERRGEQYLMGSAQKRVLKSWVWWCNAGNLPLEGPRQEDCEDNSGLKEICNRIL